MWLIEHDSRLAAETQIKSVQSNIESLQKQQQVVTTQVVKELQPLQIIEKQVQTAPEAIKVLTNPAQVSELGAVPLDIQTLPNAPDQVAVKALPLVDLLDGCKQDNLNLGGCTTTLNLQKQIDGDKDLEITALKAKPKFWSRVTKGLKVIGCSAGGAAFGSLVKGSEGAAVGAGLGAGICQIF